MSTHAMSTHVTAEELSAYLDRELPAPETREIENHLADCPACRTRFAGMHKVVASLRHLERMAPPPTLGGMVARRVTLEGERHGLLDRLESGMGLFGRQSTLLSLFGLVVAFAIMILLFAQALEERRNSSIPVIFHDPMMRSTESREVAERLFHHQAEVWVEAGLDAEPQRVVAADSPEWDTLVADHPELADLQELQEPVILKVDGDVLLRGALARNP